MNIPAHLLEDQKPEVHYLKSNYTWFAVAGAVISLIPYILFVISYVGRISNRNKFLEQLGDDPNVAMDGVQDMLTYVLMLFMGLVVVGILTGMVGIVIMLVKYNGPDGFKVIRAGCGTALACQGILIICACVAWVAKALALFNGDAIVEGVRIVATPSRIYNMTILVFLNEGMLLGVWLLVLPALCMIYFSEKDLGRRQVKHV